MMVTGCGSLCRATPLADVTPLEGHWQMDGYMRSG